jgi:hypothetical protein
MRDFISILHDPWLGIDLFAARARFPLHPPTMLGAAILRMSPLAE